MGGNQQAKPGKVLHDYVIKETFDKSKPVAELRVRFHDNSSKMVTFNVDQKIQNLFDLVNKYVKTLLKY